MARFDNGGQIEAFVGEPAIAGKYYYAEDLKGFNFERRRMRFADALSAIVATHRRSGSPSIYVGFRARHDFLPGFAAQNALPLLAAHVAPRIWLGHASNVSAHYDAVDNLACVVAGTRRFTLFPRNPSTGSTWARSTTPWRDNPSAWPPPRRRTRRNFRCSARSKIRRCVPSSSPAMRCICPSSGGTRSSPPRPSMGWSIIGGTPFAGGPDAPYTGMLLTMITIAERPPAERQAWKAFFDHYVFRSNGHPLAHLPAEQHGLLGPLKPTTTARSAPSSCTAFAAAEPAPARLGASRAGALTRRNFA